jgi:hypothetical protein
MRKLGLNKVSRGLRVFVANTPGEPIAGEYGTIYVPMPFNFKTDALRTNGIQWIMLTEEIE